MRVTRVLDMTIFLLVAVAVLLPRPDAKVKPALAALDEPGQERVAELQSLLLGHPGDIDASLELSNLFMDARRPDWVLAALAPAIERHPSDHRLFGLRALALADDFEAGAAFAASDRALTLCHSGSSAPCGPAARARLELVHGALARIKDVDMRKDPNAAKVGLIESLRPSYLTPPPVAKKPTPHNP